MRPYKATYTDGTITRLTKDEAIFIVRTARNIYDPKVLDRSRAEARGLLELLDEGLDGLFFPHVTITRSLSAYLAQSLPWLALFVGLVAVANGRFDVAAFFVALGCFFLLS